MTELIWPFEERTHSRSIVNELWNQLERAHATLRVCESAWLQPGRLYFRRFDIHNLRFVIGANNRRGGG